MEWPTLNHVFYIPLILAIGVLAGYWWGRQMLRAEIAQSEEARQIREARKAERIARLQQQKEAKGGSSPDPSNE